MSDEVKTQKKPVQKKGKPNKGKPKVAEKAPAGERKYYVVFGGYVKGEYVNARQVASNYKLNFNKCYLVDNQSVNPKNMSIAGCINVLPPVDGKYDVNKYHEDSSKIVTNKPAPKQS